VFVSIDNQISRAQEVEELFEEIMQSVADGTILPGEPPHSNTYPFIPSDSDLNQKFFRRIPPTEMFGSLEIIETHTIEHSIQMMPRHVSEHEIHVHADEFYRNRNKAMRKVPTSRLEELKYNFGGYIPETTIKIKRNVLSCESYSKYLSQTRTDFMKYLPISNYQNKELEAEINLKEKDQPEEAIESDSDSDISFSEGYWNARVLERLHPDVVQEDISPEDLVLHQVPNGQSFELRIARICGRLGMAKQNRIQLATLLAKKPAIQQYELMEALEQCTLAILSRERQLSELVSMEYQIGKPLRFWTDSVNQLRRGEAVRRELEEGLKLCSQRVIETLNNVEKRLPHFLFAITFFEDDYRQKMKRDYVQMLHELHHPISATSKTTSETVES
jgi:hypothetical protein